MINIKLLGIAMLAVVLSACGGGSGSSGASPSSQANASSTPSNNQSSVSDSSSSEDNNGGTASSTGGSGSSTPNGGNSSTSGTASSAGGGQSSLPSHPDISSDCVLLSTDRSVNWRDTSLQTDQEIVECLSTTLGRAVGYGENALGGYDPNGNSKLTVINTSDSRSVEEQLKDAIASDEHNWIVFDKVDFSDEFEISFHRLWCSDAGVLSAIGGTTQECLDYRTWCQNRSYTNHEACMEEFFNKRLNSGSLNNVRNPIVGSNTTIDGRQNNAYFRFMGFRIGNDSSGVSTQMSNSVIIAHIDFKGAGHNEDHKLDPDMIRSTGESHDIWIHKNRFDLTGDSAFDVKVGAYNITMSFNEVIDVKRAALHGSSDNRVINEQITTTMHHNAFFTRDERYNSFGNTGRRVPLIRRGSSHMFNNVFTNYRKDIMSVRVGARVLFEDNAFLINQIHQEKDSLETSLTERQEQLLRDVDSSHLQVTDSYLWFSEGTCKLIAETQRDLSDVKGSGVADLSLDYTNESRTMMWANYLLAGQDLVDYVSATAGPDGELPFNSPLAKTINEVLGADRCSGLPPASGGPGGGLPAPDKPDLEVNSLVVGELTLTWPDVNRANSYTLRYGTTDDLDGDLAEVANVTSPYTLPSLDGGVTYYIFLRADGVSGGSDWAEAQATTIDPNVPPAAPATPRIRVGNEQLTVTWDQVPGASNYEVIYNTVDTESGANVFVDNPVFGNSAVITGLTNDTTYYVFVRAGNDAGFGDYSHSVSATPSEAEPASCYVDDFTGSFGTLSTDGSGQVNSFAWSGRRIDYGSGVLKSNNSEGVGVGFFAEQSESVELRDIGDRIRLVADFSIPSTTRQLDLTELRIALVQSIGDRPVAGTADIGTTPSWSTPYKAILGSTAYNSRSGETVSAGSMGVYERNQSNSRPMGDNGVAGYTSLANGGESYSTGSGLAAEPLSLVLEVELVDDGKVDITFSYKHNDTALSSMTISDHATTTLSFDGVGVFFRRNGHIEFNSFIVEHLPVGNTDSACDL